jgi:hypothetical protein
VSRRFRAELTLALAGAYEALRAQIGDERLYAFGVYTSGEDDFQYVIATANTEEQLGGREKLRWNPCDWAYHESYPPLSELEVPRDADEDVYEDFVAALRTLDDRGAFGKGAARVGVALLILCGDMSEGFLRRGMRRLNPPEVLEAYVRDHTSDPYFERIAQLPDAERVERLLTVYVDLAMLNPSEVANEARRGRATQHEVLDRLVSDGVSAIDALVALVDEYALAEGWNSQGLATASAFAIAQIGNVPEAAVARLQEILARRVEADAGAGQTFPVAENIARALHTMRPRRFPKTVVDDKTGHLRNPLPFLPRGR